MGRITQLLNYADQFLKTLTPVFDLLARIWIAYVFLNSGLGKLADWQSTLLLFAHEYHVPLLSPQVAAIVGTILELVLPVLLLVGLGGRLMIFTFFVYNIMTVISYPFLWTIDGLTGLFDHISWGLILGLLMTHGPGKLSLDYLLQRYLRSKKNQSSSRG